MASHWPAATLVEIWNSLPGVTPAERFNNAIDAALAIPTIRHGTLSGPREAAAQWFGPPESGPDAGMYNWKHGSIDDSVQVILRPGAEQKNISAPTVDVFDAGNGIPPQDFARTILSLQGGNPLRHMA